jgi:hypothetical protein
MLVSVNNIAAIGVNKISNLGNQPFLVGAGN